MKWISSSLKTHIRGVNFLIIRFDNKILIQQRDQGIKKFPGYYCIPGGAVESNETPEEAVSRETMEETDILMHKNDFLHIGDFVYLMDKKLRVNSLYLCFVDNPTFTSKEGQMTWISLQQMKRIKLARNENVLLPRVEKFIKALRE